MEDDSDAPKFGVIVRLGTPMEVRLDSGGIVRAQVSGKIRKNFVTVKIGDRVSVEHVPYDPERWVVKKLF